MAIEKQEYDSMECVVQPSPELRSRPTKKDADGYITVIFPALNKSSNLAENNQRILEDRVKERCKVVKSIEVSDEEYGRLANSFIESEPLWEGIGGTEVNGEDIEKHLNRLRANKGLKAIEDWDLYYANNDPISDNYQNDHYMLIKAGYGYTKVVEVASEGKESFYVNTEGFSYARYVGMAIYDDRINRDLDSAICNNDLKLVIEAISKGADVNYAFYARLSPLHRAVLLGNYEIVKELLKQGADPLRKSRSTGNTSLCYANETQNIEMIRLINRAELETRCKGIEETPSLLQAAMSGDTKLRRELLAKAAGGQIIRLM